MRIVTGGMGVLAVVRGLEPVEALCPGIVNVLDEGDERSRRSGRGRSRHFEWRMG